MFFVAKTQYLIRIGSCDRKNGFDNGQRIMRNDADGIAWLVVQVLRRYLYVMGLLSRGWVCFPEPISLRLVLESTEPIYSFLPVDFFTTTCASG